MDDQTRWAFSQLFCHMDAYRRLNPDRTHEQTEHVMLDLVRVWVDEVIEEQDKMIAEAEQTAPSPLERDPETLEALVSAIRFSNP